MRSFLSIILILFAAVSANSIVLSPAQQQVDLREKGQTVPHTQWNIPADMPDVYYNNVPTDWYYCDLSNNWKNIHSANPESMDYGPELYVGRLMCNEKEQIMNNTDKLLRYSLNPGDGNFQYLQQSFYIEGYDLYKYYNTDEGKVVSESFGNIHTDTTILREQPYLRYPKGSDVINTINSHQFGFLSFHNHGYPFDMDTYGHSKYIGDYNHGNTYYDSGIRYKIFPLQEYRTTPQDSLNGFDNIQNKYYPNIAYSVACDHMPYDKPTLTCDSLNMGQSFTLGKDYGGPIFLGNTRSGYIHSSAYLECKFAQMMNSGQCKVGEAEAWSKFVFKSNGASNYLSLVHNLFGDPEMEMWTDIPSCYSGITESRENNCIVVSGLNPLDTVAYTNNAGESLRLLPTAGNCTFNNISPNGCIMVYRHNYIPYIAPLILQNETVENNQYVIATSLVAGNHVDDNRTSGDFIIPSGKQFEVEYINKVVLTAGFKVNEGGVFKARLGAATYKNQ